DEGDDRHRDAPEVEPNVMRDREQEPEEDREPVAPEVVGHDEVDGVLHGGESRLRTIGRLGGRAVRRATPPHYREEGWNARSTKALVRLARRSGNRRRCGRASTRGRIVPGGFR